MRKAIRGNISEIRLLTLQQGCDYTGMGRSSFRKWAEQVGACRKIGSMVRFDKSAIDTALDTMGTEVER